MTDLGLKINYGLSANLPSKTPGNIYVCIDNQKVYVDLLNEKGVLDRMLLGDTITLTNSIKDLSENLNELSKNLSTVASSGSYNDLIDKPTIPTAANKGYSGYLSSGADGVTEVGRYFDFHVKDNNGNVSENDYDTRLQASDQKKQNTITLSSSNGTLVIGDKEYIIKVSKESPSSNTADNVITFVTG